MKGPLPAMELFLKTANSTEGIGWIFLEGRGEIPPPKLLEKMENDKKKKPQTKNEG